jgi:hypothetical protein
MSSGSFFRARTCNRDPNRQVSVCGARGEGLLDASERGREEAAVESAAESAMMWKRTRGRRVRRRRVCSVPRRGSRDKNESKARSLFPVVTVDSRELGLVVLLFLFPWFLVRRLPVLLRLWPQKVDGEESRKLDCSDS